jgi:cytochrome c oxidase cbb3-type subunit III
MQMKPLTQPIKKPSMFLKNFMHKKIAGTAMFLFISLTMLAQTPAAPAASGNNLLAILLIVTAIVLVFVIWGMGQVLIALSRQLMNKTKEDRKMAALSVVVILSLLSNNVLAQTAAATDAAAKVVPNYGGVSPNTFYLLVAVIVTEIFAVLFLFFSIRRVIAELLPEKVAAAAKKSSMAALWTKLDSKYFTKSIPVEHEADALLDHDYDGIQELDNSLPPWWKYGFVITIGFACVYILNFHVFGNGKNPTQEYAAEMASAQAAKEAYEANNKDKIDEANVPMADAAGVNKGKEYFMANCVACHGTKGEGGAGPNLTDDYWLHKGSLNAIYNTLKVGYAEKGMQSWAIKFNPKEMSEIASFVKTLKGTNPPNGKAPQGDIYAEETAGAAAPADSLKVNKPDSSIVKK